MAIVDVLDVESDVSGYPTIASDLGEFPWPRDVCPRVLAILRECGEDARDWGANQMLACVMETATKKYLVVAHDGTPFKDKKDIVIHGLRMNHTGSHGAALQGMGLIQSTWLAADSGDIEIIIASQCKSGFVACRGRPAGINNWNSSEDVTSEFQEILGKLFGSDFKQYTVFYIFRLRDNCDLSTLLTPKIMCPMSFLTSFVAHENKQKKSDNPGGVKFYYRTTPCNLESPDFKNIQKGRIKGGAYRRQCPSRGYLLAAYSDDHFSVPTKFEVPIDEREGYFWEIRGSIDLYTFPGNNSEKDNSWLGNIRAGHELGYGFSKGGGSGFSHPLVRGALKFPAISSIKADDGSDINCLSRFTDTATYMFKGIRQFTNALSLPYVHYEGKTKGKDASPFVFIEFNITKKIRKVVRHNDGSTEKHDVSFRELSHQLKRRADFIFNNKELVSAICHAACEGADEAALKEVRLKFEKMFPPSDEEWVSLFKPSKEKRSRRFTVVNMLNGEKLRKLGHPTEDPKGITIYCAIWDAENKTWANKVTGVDLLNFLDPPRPGEGSWYMENIDHEHVLSKVEKEFGPNPKVFTATISPLIRHPLKGKPKLITSEQYVNDVKNGSVLVFPHRNVNVNVSASEESVTLWRMDIEIPVDKDDGEDDSGNRIGGSCEGEGSTCTTLGEGENGYVTRDPWYLGEWNSKFGLWFWNQNHPWVKKWYHGGVETIIETKLREINDHVQHLANSYVKSTDLVDANSIKKPDGLSEEAASESSDEICDGPLNEFVKRLVEGENCDRFIEIKLTEIQKYSIKYG